MNKIKRIAQIASVVMSTSAIVGATPSVEDYAALMDQSHKHINTTNVVRQENNDWLSSIRDNIGNTIRWVGNQVRKREDLATDISVLRNLVKETATDYIKSKTGLTITQSMMNGVGNAIRWFGGKIRTCDESQKLERVIMNAGHMHATTKTQNVVNELRKVSAAMVQTRSDNTSYIQLVEALQDRGHDVKEPAYNMYAEEVAKDVLKNKQLFHNEAEAKKTLTQRLTSFLERIGVAKTFQNIQQYVGDLYNKVKTWINWDSDT